MRGRKPKPTVLKIVQGNPGHRPINHREPQPDPGIPSCPPHLNDVAREEWDRITRELSKLSLLTQVDRAALAAYCCLYARWVEAEGLVGKGLVYQAKKRVNGEEVPTGLIKVNPAVKIATETLALMRQYLTEFGLSPSSRSRLSVGQEAKPEDEYEAFLRGTG